MVSSLSRAFNLPYVHLPTSIHQAKSSNPTNPAIAPTRFPLILLPTAPDLGAAVLLELGAGVVDDELDDTDAEELGAAEDAIAELAAVDEASALETVEVTRPPNVEVALATVAIGVGKEDESVRMTVGTEAVEAKLSVAAETAPWPADDTLAPPSDAAWEAVAAALWAAAEA